MMHKIENEYLTAEISELGAQLFSLKSKATKREYLWQGNPKYWSERSPVLFPICGRLYSGKYTYQGREYEMSIHGIAKLFSFEACRVSAEKMSFTLRSSEKTREYYPIDFEFTVSYSLVGNVLKTDFAVKNTSGSDMYFSYGAHPGFNVPLVEGENFEDYYLEFSQNELSRLVFSEACFVTGECEKYPLSDKKLPLSHELFNDDALFFETEAEKVILRSVKSDVAVEVEYQDMTSLGLWQTSYSDALYLCIEPWHGIPSLDGMVDDFETKRQTIRLAPLEEYENSYTIKIIDG